MAEKRGNNKPSNLGPFALLVILLFFLALIDISTLIIWRFPAQPSSQSSSTSNLDSAKVTEIIDGDTIKLENGKYVRLIGINAPKEDFQYYEESAKFLSFLILNKQVRLERDVDDTDTSGRLLRYVYVDYGGKQLFINVESVRQGYSIPMPVEPNTKYKSVMEQARNDCLKDKIYLCG